MKYKINRFQKIPRLLSGYLILCFLTACSLDGVLEVDSQEEGREVDRSLVVTRAGGIALFNGAFQDLQFSVSSISQHVALMTDELSSVVVDGNLKDVDSRQRGRDRDGVSYGLMMPAYSRLHSVRNSAGQAVSILTSLKDSSVNAIIAASYAIHGYSLLLFAENYCSGIPLTAVPFDGDIEYGYAQSTSELFKAAIAKFDSSLAISHDSVKFITLAKIGKARAEMGLGNYKEAAEAVEGVAVNDAFYLGYTEQVVPGATSSSLIFWTTRSSGLSPGNWETTEVLNSEGGNGLVWYHHPDSIDPRVPVTTDAVGGVSIFPAIVRQKKFEGGTLTFPLARGVESLLIQAEYALQQERPDWIDYINEARAIVGLSALTDPVNRDGRVDLLFKERGYWFYLEGVRLGDYRRLVRQYARNPYSVYPTGLYTQSSGEIPFYGDAWVFGVPKDEYVDNYRYKGCLSWNP